jgi:hypothetical protein
MWRFLRTIVVLTISSLTLSACNLFPEPSSLIHVPKLVKAVNSSGVDYLSIAKRNLPKGTEISIPDGPVGVEPVIYSDFDGDGKGEILVFFHSVSYQNQVGAFLLKKKKNRWEKVFAKTGSGQDINWASAADITGDGKDEILLGWQSGGSAGNVLEVYTWKKSKLVKLDELPYNEIEVIQFENDKKSRLALWNRDLADVFKIQLLVWGGKGFTPDIAHYPSYYQKVIDYYNRRIGEVPDAAYYWYYLADAYNKANHPELALDAINKGMSLKTINPTFDHFKQLKDSIVARNNEVKDKPVNFEVSTPYLSFDAVRDIAPYISTKKEPGKDDGTIITVEVSPDKKKRIPLFSIEVYSKDLAANITDQQLVKFGEYNDHIYFIRKDDIPPDEKDKMVLQAMVQREKMISSIKLGPVYTKFTSVEDKSVINLLNEAAKKYWYVMTGGKMPEGKIETVSINNSEFRYMGKDLDTNIKLTNYLSDIYTTDAIQSFKIKYKIFEYFGRLVQPNADVGSTINYQYAEVVQKKDNDNVKEFDIRAPLGSSYNFETVHIGFQKTENGWRIFTEPGSF